MLLLPHILHQSGETGSSDDDALVWYMCLLPSQERGERTTIKKTQQFHPGFVVLFDHFGALDGGVFEKTMVPANIALAMLKGMVADGVYLEGLSEYSAVPNLRSFCSTVHRCCQLVLGRGGRYRPPGSHAGLQHRCLTRRVSQPHMQRTCGMDHHFPAGR